MTIAREGLREIAISTLLLGGAAAGAGLAALRVSGWFAPLALLLAGLWLFTILFFRDPAREIPGGDGILVSPADGKVTEISTLDTYPGIDGPALRVGIFLSVFDVHINRTPCAGRVLRTEYRPGEFLDARHPECGLRNESNTIVLQPAALPGPIIVRQIAGLIARRIISHLHEGDAVAAGQRFGLIKFGSRTEVIVPAGSGLEPAVQINDVVRGGATILMRVGSRSAPGAVSRRSAGAAPAAAGAR